MPANWWPRTAARARSESPAPKGRVHPSRGGVWQDRSTLGRGFRERPGPRESTVLCQRSLHLFQGRSLGPELRAIQSERRHGARRGLHDTTTEVTLFNLELPTAFRGIPELGGPSQEGWNIRVIQWPRRMETPGRASLALAVALPCLGSHEVAETSELDTLLAA